MNQQPTLHFDCLRQIVSFVSLPECMVLRSVCRELKTAVDAHFRSKVRALPVLLSAQYSSRSVAEYDKFYSRPKNRITTDFGAERRTHGSAFGYWKMWEPKNVYENEHFRSENYLVLFDFAKFDSLLAFITKYFPGITKLSLRIDHQKHFANIPEMLKVHRKQLKVLVLEKTFRSRIDFPFEKEFFEEKNRLPIEKLFVPPLELYSSIEALDGLEKLYFFAKTVNTKKIPKNPEYLLDSTWDQPRPVVERGIGTQHFGSSNWENLKELECEYRNTFVWDTAQFPQLEKLIVLRSNTTSGCLFERFLNPEFAPNLQNLGVQSTFNLDNGTMDDLNDFANLKELHVESITRSEAVAVVNESIKFIEIDEVLFEYFCPWNGPMFRKPYNRAEQQTALQDLRESLRLFTGVEKVVIRKPFMVFTEDDRWRFNV